MDVVLYVNLNEREDADTKQVCETGERTLGLTDVANSYRTSSLTHPMPRGTRLSGHHHP